MNIQNQINHCINHLNEIGDGVGMVEISKDSQTVLVYSFKNPTQYCTIYSIYTEEQLEIFQDRSIGEMIQAANKWHPEWDEN